MEKSIPGFPFRIVPFVAGLPGEGAVYVCYSEVKAQSVRLMCDYPVVLAFRNRKKAKKW